MTPWRSPGHNSGWVTLPRAQQPWTVAFTRSRLSPVVFNVDRDWEQPVLAAVQATGLIRYSALSMFDSGFGSIAVLDGFVVDYAPYGFPAAKLRAGVRVLGFDTLRLVCHLLGLRPPSRRLHQDDAVRTESDLREALAEQLALPEVDRAARSQIGLGIEDRETLDIAITEAWGEGYGAFGAH